VIEVRPQRDTLAQALVERLIVVSLPSMENMTAYAISIALIGFGIWVAIADLGSVTLLSAWPVLGAASIAVGAASIANEIHNHLHGVGRWIG
jgi:hypothetical protein